MIYFTAHTFKCVCHCIRTMFRVLGVYNFAPIIKTGMKNYADLTIIFALVLLLGSIPISEGFYGPTNSFMNNKLEVMRHLSARTRNHPIDQEVYNHYQRSTRRPKTSRIFVPQNNDRFDAWGG